MATRLLKHVTQFLCLFYFFSFFTPVKSLAPPTKVRQLATSQLPPQTAADVPAYNEAVRGVLYPTWRFSNILYSKSIRPTLALPQYANSPDDGSEYFLGFVETDTDSTPDQDIMDSADSPRMRRSPSLRNENAMRQEASPQPTAPSVPPPEPIEVRVHPFSIISLDETEEAFAIDLFLTARWKDWRLQFNVTQTNASAQNTMIPKQCFYLDGDISGSPTGEYEMTYKPGTMNPYNLWIPKVFSDMMDATQPANDIQMGFILCPGGEIIQYRHSIFTFRQRLNRRKYPFDDHFLHAAILDPHFEPWKVLVKIVEKEVGWTASSHLLGWKIGNLHAEVRYKIQPKSTGVNSVTMKNKLLTEGELHAAFANFTVADLRNFRVENNGPFTVIYLTTHIERRVEYCIFTQVFPLVVVVLMGGAAYCFLISATELRLTIVITSVLTIMALSSFLSTSLPQVEYLTWIHMVLITSHAYLLFALLHTVLAAVLLHGDFVKVTGGEEGSVTRRELLGYLKHLMMASSVEKESEEVRPSFSSRFAEPDVKEKFQDCIDCSVVLDRLERLQKNYAEYFANMMTISVAAWTVEETVVFFDYNGYKECADKALKSSITGTVLMELDSEGLLELGAGGLIDAAKLKVTIRKHNKFRMTRRQRYRIDCDIFCFPSGETDVSSDDCNKTPETISSRTTPRPSWYKRVVKPKLGSFNERLSRFGKKANLYYKYYVVFLDAQLTWFHPVSFILVIVLTYCFVVLLDM